MSDFVKLYEPYNNSLIKELDIDWYDAQERYNKIGNSPGIYPDSLMCLVEFVKRDDIKHILEIGSGMSTLYLAKAAKKYNKNFISIEESIKYADFTRAICKSYNINQEVLMFANINYSTLPKPDMLFIDSDSDSRTTLLETIERTSVPIWHPKDIKFILLDDAEAPIFTIPIFKSLSRYNRYNHCIFNPVARQDRHLLINCTDDNLHVPNWYWTWRPDKKFW